MRVVNGGNLKHKEQLFLFNEIVKPIFDTYQRDVSMAVNDNEIPDNEIMVAKAFVNHSLTEDDKISISKEIKFIFDWEIEANFGFACEIELSERPDIIESGIERWSKDKFNFSPDGW